VALATDVLAIGEADIKLILGNPYMQAIGGVLSTYASEVAADLVPSLSTVEGWLVAFGSNSTVQTIGNGEIDAVEFLAGL